MNIIKLYRSFNNYASRAYFWILAKLLYDKRMHYGKGLIVKGMPIIEIHSNGYISIGKGVTLNSSNRKYHLNMHSPVKLVCDSAGARITIGDYSRIHGTCIHAVESVSIGSRCLIAANCNIIDSNGHDLSFGDVSNRINTKGNASKVVIEDCVWIGSGSLVLPGSHIDTGSVIAAGSIVNGYIPPYTLAGGIPAKVIKEFKDAGETNQDR